MPTVELPEGVFAWLQAKAATEQARLAAAGIIAPYTVDDLASQIIEAVIPADQYRLVIERDQPAPPDLPF